MGIGVPLLIEKSPFEGRQCFSNVLEKLRGVFTIVVHTHARSWKENFEFECAAHH